MVFKEKKGQSFCIRNGGMEMQQKVKQRENVVVMQCFTSWFGIKRSLEKTRKRKKKDV